MCGIVGAITTSGNLSTHEIGIFTQLLYCSALRGSDSTGVMSWDGDRVDIIKSVLHPADFIFTKEYQNFIKDRKIKMIFGHTRLATSGDIKPKNAHPFRFGHIALMHNGNVSNVPGEKKVKEFDVDSQALADALSREDVETVFKQFDGAVACVWFNDKEKSINMYRNYQRPLHITTSSITQYIASEKKMLDWVVDRNNAMYGNVIKELPPNHLLKLQAEDLRKEPILQKIEREWKGGAAWSEADPFPGTNRSWAHRGYENYNSRRPALPAPVSNIRDINSQAKADFANISEGAKDENPYIILREDGPFRVGKKIHVVVYDKERYTVKNGTETLWKILGSPIFTGEDLEFNIPKWDVTKCVMHGFTEADADKLLQEGFLQAEIINIRYFREWKDPQDRLTVYLMKPTPIQTEVISAKN